MTTYDQLIASADERYARADFKEAHITYGKAIAAGGGRDGYCRHMRGICSRLVAEERMEKAEGRPELRQQFVDQAAKWLCKSEANLGSALEECPAGDRAAIRAHQAETEETIARFMRLGGGDPGRRLSLARRYREEAASGRAGAAAGAPEPAAPVRPALGR